MVVTVLGSSPNWCRDNIRGNTMVDIKTFRILHHPVWEVPAVSAMTNEDLIKELERRGYMINKEERKSDGLLAFSKENK